MSGRTRVEHVWRCLLVSLLLLWTSAPLLAQSAENVLVVANSASADSVRIGEYYVRKRSVPADQFLRLAMPVDDEVDRGTYQHQIEAPLAAWLVRNSAQDRILYIVLTKGVPLRVSGTRGRDGTVASVDSELTLLYRRMLGTPPPIGGRVDNPYYARALSPTAKRFTHEVADIYLVTRLDGFTVGDVTALIDRAASPSQSGEIVLDQKGTGLDRTGDRWLEDAATQLRGAGFNRVVLERTTTLVTGRSGLLGYYSWGSNDPAFRSRRLGLGFVPGALAATYVSTDARTFREPPAEWSIGSWNEPATFFAGSPQSLAADLIREGATGVAGHVAEPYLDATIRPYVLFPAYVSGFNLAEAFYLAMPYLSWQTVVVGDPLCAPFQTGTLTRNQIDEGLDPATELPRLFGRQRLERMSPAKGSPAARALLLKADVRMARDDRAGVRAALEEALKTDPACSEAENRLAMLDAAENHYDRAVERYRRVLLRAPNDVLALNNLADALATRLGKPAEALPFAERAVTASHNASYIMDTLAWTRHLLGNDQSAGALLDQILRVRPMEPEIYVHAATVHLALGSIEAANRDLAEYHRLAPTAAARDDVAQLEDRLKKAKKP